MYYNRFTDKVLEENKLLKWKIEMYEADDAIRRINDICEKRLRTAQEHEKRQHDGWMKCLEANKEIKRRNTELREENENYKCRLKSALRKSETMTERAVREAHRRELLEEENEKLKEEIKDKEARMEAMEEEIRRLKSRLDADGTTNGIPTSQTPADKNKVIPNTREKSNRKRGGQPGREKKTLRAFGEDEVTINQRHVLDQCPECGGELEELQDQETRDESDYEVKIIKKRHKYPKYRCKKCGKTVQAEIPYRLREENQYGPEVQAMLLALLDLGFVSVSRAREILTGMLGGKLSPSEGYVGKIQKKAARGLKEFRQEVRKACLGETLLHWDDTVIFMNTKRACFRFYGNKKLAYYTAHEKKDAAGIEADGILSNLTEKTALVHDHVKYNYRKEFLFRNIECVQHLERELQKVYNESGHEWAKRVKELIGETIHKRKEHLEKGERCFTDQETTDFEDRLENLMIQAKRESEKSVKRYYHGDEINALKKLEEYRENYFAWVYDFDIPTTNNLAESSLRMTKTKMKVSGQFQKERTADEFAAVRTYIETCKRNGKNVYEALRRLMEGHPYTLTEVLAHE